MGSAGESSNCWAEPLRFPYGQYEVEPTPGQPEQTIVYRPVIPIGITGEAGTAVFYGLLDTGADETLLPKKVADLIGIKANTSQTSTVMSASGEMTVSYGRVTIEIGHGRQKYRWGAIVGIVEQPWQEALLGHIGFLRYFDVTFLGAKQEVKLKRNTIPFPKE